TCAKRRPCFWSPGIPMKPRIAAVTNRMWAIASHVAAPATISVRTVEPRSEMWKYRSSPLELPGGASVLAIPAPPPPGSRSRAWSRAGNRDLPADGEGAQRIGASSRAAQRRAAGGRRREPGARHYPRPEFRSRRRGGTMSDQRERKDTGELSPIGKAGRKAGRYSREFVATVISLLTTALGVVAALAWNSALTKLFETYLGPGGAVAALFIYAVAITVISVIVI